MYPRTALLLLFVISALVVTVGIVRAQDAPPTDVEARKSAVTIPFQSDEPVSFQLQSDDVIWRGQTFHLLRLVEAKFSLDETAHLRASLKGGSTTFDDVEYTIHAAVFDSDGMLLGTASTTYQVQRVWVGVLVHVQVKLDMDFGISKRYTDAASVMLTTSSMDVLTPDQWQEE